MKFTEFVLIILLSIPSLAFANNPFPILSSAIAERSITLIAGTLITIEAVESITVGQLSEKSLIKFEVQTNIIVERRVVIKAGTIVFGKIQTNTSSHTISIALHSVKAVDGQEVYLNGEIYTFQNEAMNSRVIITPGETIVTNVKNDMIIIVK